MPDIKDLSPYLEGLFLTAGLADWAQTRQIARDTSGVKFYEKNPIMGERPTQGKVNTYMPIAGLAQYAGYEALPDKWKLPYALATALAEANIVRKNQEKGLDVNKPALLLGAALTGGLVNLYNKKKENRNIEVRPDLIDGNPGARVNLYW